MGLAFCLQKLSHAVLEIPGLPNNRLGVLATGGYLVNIGLNPVHDFGGILGNILLGDCLVSFHRDGLWVENPLGSYLVRTFQRFLVCSLGLFVNFGQQIEGKKLELALAIVIDVKIQALVVVFEVFLSESNFISLNQ